jgi:hypothetical protein
MFDEYPFTILFSTCSINTCCFLCFLSSRENDPRCKSSHVLHAGVVHFLLIVMASFFGVVPTSPGVVPGLVVV